MPRSNLYLLLDMVYLMMSYERLKHVLDVKFQIIQSCIDSVHLVVYNEKVYQ
jgi:hypothetical protein